MDFTIHVMHRKYLGITYNMALLFLEKKKKILALARLVNSEMGLGGWKPMSASMAHHLRYQTQGWMDVQKSQKYKVPEILEGFSEQSKHTLFFWASSK